MLTPDDAALTQRNPSIPGLPVLLDPEAFLASLRPHLPKLEGPLETFYLRYKPATSALAGYRGFHGGEPMVLYARAHRRGDFPKFRDDEQVGHARRPIALPGLNTIVRLFPQDLELCMLQCFADVGSRRTMLRGLLPNSSDLWGARLRCLRYKPERRYVGALVVGSRPAATLRIFSETEYQDVLQGPKWLRSRDVLRVPKRLGRRSRYCTLVYEWLEGRPLQEVLESNAAEAALRSVGIAAAELHSQRSNGSRVFTPSGTASRLSKLAEAIADLCPAMGGYVHRLAADIAQRVSETASAKRTIHADFHAGQVLLAAGAVGLIDLDQVALGDAAVDLGNFIAHLYRQAITSDQDAAQVRRLADALCDGYHEASKKPIPRRRIRLYTAVGLLHVAPHFFRRRDPDWVLKIGSALSLADEELRVHDAGSRANVAVLRELDRQNDAPPIVSDPFSLRENPQMAFLAGALDEASVCRELLPLLQLQRDIRSPLQVKAIRAVRYKPTSRCLIEYDVTGLGPDGAQRSLTIIGKARIRGAAHSTYRLMEKLIQCGFDDDSADQVSVPGVLGIVAPWHMWLQRKVHGRAATALLPQSDGIQLARRIAAALVKLHAAKVPARRRHTMNDELSILEDRLAEVAQSHPAWRDRLSQILDGCHRIGKSLSQPQLTPIHRDFYPDHVLTVGERLYLIDFDLYCQGDPAVDLGNFCGHLVEQGLRTLGSPEALADCEAALVDHYQELTGATIRPAVNTYTTLTLARHISISARIPARSRLTGQLIELCEQRLGLQQECRI